MRRPVPGVVVEQCSECNHVEVYYNRDFLSGSGSFCLNGCGEQDRLTTLTKNDLEAYLDNFPDSNRSNEQTLELLSLYDQFLTQHGLEEEFEDFRNE